MISQNKNIWLISIILLLLLTACKDEKKDDTQKVQNPAHTVSKKIEKKIDIQPQAKPEETPKELSQQVPEAKKEVAAPETPEQVPADASKTDDKKEEAPAQQPPQKEESVQAENKDKGFDPTGKINPFMPFMADETEKAAEVSEESKKEKREPLTPLEKIDIAQLKLTAITRTPTGNIALVEEASGKGYIITEGTYIGLNSGKVISVLSDKVIIEEEIENIFGKVSIQERELKLQKPTGE